MRLSAIIPAYNEEKNIKNTVERVYDFLIKTVGSFEVIIVDDGSRDSTASVIHTIQKKLPYITVVSLPKNRGKGYAVKTGVQHAQGEYILFLDADGSTPISELTKFLEAHGQGADIGIGSRYLARSAVTIKQPWQRVALGRFGNRLIQVMLLPGIKDTQCGFKTFRADVAKKIYSLQTIDRWGFDMEILALAKLLGYTIKEIPVSWHDTTNRKSRFRPFKDAHRTLKDLVKIKCNLLKGVYTNR